MSTGDLCTSLRALFVDSHGDPVPTRTVTLGRADTAEVVPNGLHDPLGAVGLAAAQILEAQFGQRGSEPTDFDPPHGLAMDKEGRLYVADRGNRR